MLSAYAVIESSTHSYRIKFRSVMFLVFPFMDEALKCNDSSFKESYSMYNCSGIRTNSGSEKFKKSNPCNQEKKPLRNYMPSFCFCKRSKLFKFSASLIDIFRQIPNQNISFKSLTMKAAFQFAN